MATVTDVPAITEEQITRFREDGAICVRNVIDMEMVERMREAIPRVLPESEDGGSHMRQKLYLWREDDDFRHFSMHTDLPAIAAAVLEAEEVHLFADHLLVKDAGSPEPTPWHQDAPYWPLSGDQLCTIWVALDEVTLDSGAVQYVKGSHLEGKWFRPVSFTPGGQWDGPDWDTIPDFDNLRDQYEFLHWDTQPGDCIIHHPLVVHGAYANKRADRARRAIAPRYAGEDVRWRIIPGSKRPESTEAQAMSEGAPLTAPGYPRVWPTVDEGY